jgi:exosortase
MQITKTTSLAFLTLALFLVGYYPVLEILANKWANSEEYSHAFLTLPIIAYMVWNKRQLLLQDAGKSSFFGLLLLLLSTPLYLFSLLTQVHTLIALSMILAIVGILIYITGVQTICHLATPLFLLIILIPVPEQLFIQLTFPLQLKVSQASEIFVRFFGVPIFREGNVMNIPGKSFEVVEACSGLRSMITLLTLSIIVGYFMLKTNTSKGVLLLASIPIAILVNIFRVVALILFYHFFKVDLTGGMLHTLLGLLIFGLALALLLFLQKILNLWELKGTQNS